MSAPREASLMNADNFIWSREAEVALLEQDQVIAENLELRERCKKLESTVTMNEDVKKTLDAITRENSAFKAKMK
ncbi:hypothetical protein E2C01_018563 [Portunus trituberculatus]|uniref:Uncharacterized protein n=1 Tax=Portunus trituberculatus TaxID=210409 RepID=A0A5B7DWI5_PORTR|nr:hypothetical protein [Portunus trituberculatus]